jgi:hypothetical protein
MKTLLGLFGQYRTFEEVIPQLKGLDKVDIVISTWKDSSHSNEDVVLREVSEDDIKKVLPSIKKCMIHLPESKEYWEDTHSTQQHPKQSNTIKMYFHWKQIMGIEDIHTYDLVILHRTDMVSNWETILEGKFEDGTIYTDMGMDGDKLWIQDRFIIGTPNTLKKLVDGIDLNDDRLIQPHYPLGDVIIKNGLKYSGFSINNEIIK